MAPKFRGYSRDTFGRPGITDFGGRFDAGDYAAFVKEYRDYQGRVYEGFYRTATGYMQAGLVEVGAQTMSVVGGFISDSVQGFLGGLENAARDNQAIARGLERAAAYGQQAVLKAYERNVEDPRRVPSYTTGDRGHIGGGVLKRALGSPDFFRVSGDGVTFGNAELLNAVAPQWARLNYGAGTKATGGNYGEDSATGESLASYKPTYSAQHGRSQARYTFGNLALPNRSRPGFEVPPGLWRKDGKFVFPSFNPEGSNAEFVPYSREAVNEAIDQIGGSAKTKYANRRRIVQKRGPTAGIAARRFMDIGARMFFGAAQVEMVGVLNHWVEIAEGKRYVFGKTGHGPLGGSGMSVKASAKNT